MTMTPPSSRDHTTGKSRGFGFICYMDQRSTNMAVDNLNGIKVLRQLIRVDHVHNYKLPKDLEKLDQDKKKLFMEGCAPKPISGDEQSSSEEEEEVEAPVKVKKEKKKKKEKKHKKKKRAEKSDDSDSDGEDRVRKDRDRQRGREESGERGGKRSRRGEEREGERRRERSRDREGRERRNRRRSSS